MKLPVLRPPRPHTSPASSSQRKSGGCGKGEQPEDPALWAPRAWVFACLVASVGSSSLQPRRLLPARLLWPWDSPGRSTGVGCHFLLQGIFLTQGLNPFLLHCRQILYHLSHQGSPHYMKKGKFKAMCELFKSLSNKEGCMDTSL